MTQGQFTSRTDAEAEYQVAEVFRQRCFANNGSYLFPDQTVWTAETIKTALTALTSRDSAGDGRSFIQRLREQLSSADDQITVLIAETLIFYYLFPGSDTIRRDTKIARVLEVLAFKSIPKPEILDATFDQGVGGVGTHYLSAQPHVMGFFLQFALSGKEQSADFSSVEKCVAIADAIRSSTKHVGEARNALLHLLFPDDFEAIVSDQHKAKILTKYADAGYSGDPDVGLRNIRDRLSASAGHNISFYGSLRDEWDGNQSRSPTADVLPAAANLFVIPVSDARAAKNMLYSVAFPVNRVNVDDFFEESLVERARRRSGNGQIYAWGTQDGERNRPAWETMQVGDAVLFYANGNYVYTAYVVEKAESSAFAKALWNEADADGDFRLVYLLTRPVQIAIPLGSLSGYLQDTFYRGFTRTSEDRLTKIRNEFGTVNDFIDRAVLSNSDVYLCLRSNVGSQWADQEGSSYHFGDNVPNWTRVRPGAKFAVERRFEGGYKIIGFGSIGEVQRELADDGTAAFVASYDRYETLTPPRNLEGDLRDAMTSLPGYNAQHSIHVINKDVFNMMSGNQMRAQPASDPAADLAKAIYWDHDKAAKLVRLAKRSHQLIFAGPPGTGKTFIAMALAKVLTAGGAGRIEKVQFHPSYSYEDFIEGIRPRLSGGSEQAGIDDALEYRLVDGLFKRFCKSAQEDPARQYIFVIDELNRANVAAVFGELLYCLEYRGPDHDLALPYSGDRFFLPENLWVFATMNTADKSIALIDAAFRRRFRHVPLAPDEGVLSRWLTDNEVNDAQQYAARLSRLNDELRPLIGSDRLIGHYFLMDKNLQDSRLPEIWDEDLEPVLREHLFDQNEELDRLRQVFLGTTTV